MQPHQCFSDHTTAVLCVMAEVLRNLSLPTEPHTAYCCLADDTVRAHLVFSCGWCEAQPDQAAKRHQHGQRAPHMVHNICGNTHCCQQNSCHEGGIDLHHQQQKCQVEVGCEEIVSMSAEPSGHPKLMGASKEGTSAIQQPHCQVNISRTFVKCLCTRVSLHQCGKHRGSVSKMTERVAYGSS